MELARDLLALDVLERHRALGEAPLVLDGVTERRRKMVELGADRGELRRAARRDARVIATAFKLGHRFARDCSGASARPTTFIITRNSASAITEPTSSWVTMASQISAISSLGWEVITSEPDLPWIETGTLTAVCSG